METYKLTEMTFTYPGREKPALSSVSLSVKQGEFITVCGKSGCGKTTLLRLLKPQLAPHGTRKGTVFFGGEPIEALDERRAAAEIGLVMQSPENQVVTDKVWHEMAFGLESLGYSTDEIRTRVAETASFFGISNWFHNKVTDLSGGQKQILNLASVMVMQPDVLLLDEPTSRLDPIAASEFLKMLQKINRELGITVILSEHRLEEALPLSDRVIVLDEGRVIADAPPENIGILLKEHEMFDALPAPIRVYSSLDPGPASPVTVRDGKVWLRQFSETHEKNEVLIKPRECVQSDTAIELKDIFFRYEKTLPDVIKGLSVKIKKGEIFAILGGNGAGKTTALSVIAGVLSPYRGKVIKNGGLKISLLPQNPALLFNKKTVYLDLLDILRGSNLSEEDKKERVLGVASLCRIENLLDFHPYDISGGEQQRAAFAKILLLSPDVLLLDEPTKGLDAHFKKIFADILAELKADGKTIIIVSHDIDFCAEFADRCAMFFDGAIVSSGPPDKFFAGKSFYTTAANRMARDILPKAVLADDIILAFGGIIKEGKENKTKDLLKREEDLKKNVKAEKRKPFKSALGVFCVLSLVLLCVLQAKDLLHIDINIVQLIAAILFGGACLCFISKKQFDIPAAAMQKKETHSKKALIAALFILLAVPLTIYFGIYYLDDKKYLFISILIIIETLIPFSMIFESRNPKAREIVLISVLCALGTAGRTAFFMLPQFKPVVALIIISGACLGGEVGFLVGAITAFVSNMVFGQGPWTPWQMFVFGIIGFLAGVLCRKGIIKKTKLSLCLFGFFAALIIYGGIMNPAAILMFQPSPNKDMLLSSYISGFPFDLIHAASTAFFLWFIAEPMIEKIERIKLKYGLLLHQKGTVPFWYF